MSIDRERLVADAIRETMARYDAVIVLDPSKGYHYGSGPSVEFIAKGVAARIADAYEAAAPGAAREEGLRAALEAVTHRRNCGHGYTDVLHVAPAHFDGPACPSCSDADYADRMQRDEPCVICAALSTPETPGAPES